ncbi:MAG TPA: response regulator, partial [Gemmatimonas sp.]|nr:response regulator [Gemmatimonas sp.]
YENDRVVGGLGIMRDITDDTVTREADAQHARLASVGALLGGVANEINNPLAALLAIAELEASSPTLAPDDRAVLGQIRDEARRASSIVADLLESTYPRPLERVPVDLNRIVRSSLELQGYSLRQHGVKVVSSLLPESLDVHADASQLQQALINLLVNAEEAIVATARPGEMRGEMRREIHIETAADATHVQVLVTDTGGGISEADARRVFEPMFTTRSGRNSRGLGLTITRSIVRDHGGSVSFRVADNGTTFVISLPRFSQTPGAKTPDASVAEVTGARRAGLEATSAADSGIVREPSSARVPHKSLLIVEDEQALRTAMGRYFEREGYVVVTAAGGKEALDALATQRFGAILLDLRMRGMSGESTYHELLARYPDQASGVLFITGDLHSPTAAEFVRRSGRQVVPKPFSLHDLEAKVAELVQGVSSRNQSV